MDRSMPLTPARSGQSRLSWYQSQVPFVLTMSGGNSDIQNVVQDIEPLRRQSEPWKFDALRVDANRNRNDGGQRPKDQLARGGVANVPIAANIQNQIAGYNSSDEEEDVILAEDQNRPARRGGGRLKVDIPSFYGNLGIEDFVDWIAKIDHFFEYMDIPKEKRVKLVACRLKGGASAWWERLLHRHPHRKYHFYK
ncbi:hypothetical protein M9H77_14274 [Catharanthus roseus]|uniref:Uncharacterized protein n=1 Tax=Catharanthus roseus TaxID=4058 RepID=A0ACC0BML2_CATRO|nr:hypothetical protein M9H77_14274 [Catharanthus roseus]